MREWSCRLAGLSLALVLLAMPFQARAAAKDCPFVGALQNFAAPDDPNWVGYDSRDFVVVNGGQKSRVSKTGKVCKQIYRLKPGQAKMSGLEIMSNFEQSLPAAGAQITNSGRAGDDDIYASLNKGGSEYWMHVEESNGDTVTVTEVQVVPFQKTLTAPSGNDYRLLGHLPGMTSRTPVKTNFDEVAFTVQEGKQTKQVKVRGFHEKVIYDWTAKGKAAVISGIETQLNYLAALKDLGAEILYTDPGSEIVARLDDHGKTVWVDVSGGGGGAVNVNVLEEKPFQMTIKPPQADEMKTALDHDGRITLYINFDFNKATLKPDAQPVIAQVVALLKANPDLKLSVEGHTDGVGLHDYNVKLSQDRAAAVVVALKAQAIAAARLSSTGFGPDKPIAPNDTEEGRAKNRRVELVKR